MLTLVPNDREVNTLVLNTIEKGDLDTLELFLDTECQLMMLEEYPAIKYPVSGHSLGRNLKLLEAKQAQLERVKILLREQPSIETENDFSNEFNQALIDLKNLLSNNDLLSSELEARIDSEIQSLGNTSSYSYKNFPLKWRRFLNGLLFSLNEEQQALEARITKYRYQLDELRREWIYHQHNKAKNLAAQQLKLTASIDIPHPKIEALAQRYIALKLSPHTYDASTRISILHIACRSGQENIATYLLKLGANPTAVDANGHNSLDTAVYHGHLHLIQNLINHHGMKLEQKHLLHQDQNGNTLLHLAIMKQNYGFVLHLLQRDSNLFTRNHNDISAWQLIMDLNTRNHINAVENYRAFALAIASIALKVRNEEHGRPMSAFQKDTLHILEEHYYTNQQAAQASFFTKLFQGIKPHLSTRQNELIETLVLVLSRCNGQVNDTIFIEFVENLQKIESQTLNYNNLLPKLTINISKGKSELGYAHNTIAYQIEKLYQEKLEAECKQMKAEEVAESRQQKITILANTTDNLKYTNEMLNEEIKALKLSNEEKDNKIKQVEQAFGELKQQLFVQTTSSLNNLATLASANTSSFYTTHGCHNWARWRQQVAKPKHLDIPLKLDDATSTAEVGNISSNKEKNSYLCSFFYRKREYFNTNINTCPLPPVRHSLCLEPNS